MANPYQRAISVLREISKMILFEQWKKINKMLKTKFKSILKFRICSYFMHLKVLIGNNMRLYFWKFSQIKNRTLVRMGHKWAAISRYALPCHIECFIDEPEKVVLSYIDLLYNHIDLSCNATYSIVEQECGGLGRTDGWPWGGRLDVHGRDQVPDLHPRYTRRRC